MLTIKNIELIVGCSCNGWDIQRIYEAVDDPITGEYYVIDFGMQTHFRNVQETEIFLYRHKNRHNAYEMFVMGWGGLSKTMVHKDDLNNPEIFLDKLTDCLRKINN